MMRRKKPVNPIVSLLKNVGGIIIFFLLLALIWTGFQGKNVTTVPFNTVVEQVQEGKVSSVTVNGNQLLITLSDKTQETSTKESNISFVELLKTYGVPDAKITAVNLTSQTPSNVWDIVYVIASIALPILLFVFLFYSFSQRAGEGAMQAFNFGKSKAKEYQKTAPTSEKVTFKDVAGLKETKEELQEVVEFLKYPKKFLSMGARIPRGVLLVGAPGTGKTLLARAVANEANVPFFYSSGSEFVEMFVGVGASRVRDLFDTAKKNSPCIIFLDELDAIGRHRGAGIGGGHDEREQTLNQILVEMDGMERNNMVIVIAATNRPDILDPALLRPGRFDRKVVLDVPDIDGREEILKIHIQGKPMAADINLREIAERTPGFSGADLANLTNEAAILAAKRDKKEIGQDELRESIEKVILGPERKSHVLSPKEKELAAYHEAGHAVAGTFSPSAEPVQKISIVSRGLAGGYTLSVPTEEKRFKTKKQFLDEIVTLLGGFTAEKIVFKDTSTGASNDIERSTEIARDLVMRYGMSDLGPITYGKRDELVFLGKEIAEEKNFSEEMAAKIDKNITNTVDDCLKKTEKILTDHRAFLETVAKKLVEKETIEHKEFNKMLADYKAGLKA